MKRIVSPYKLQNITNISLYIREDFREGPWEVKWSTKKGLSEISTRTKQKIVCRRSNKRLSS